MFHEPSDMPFIAEDLLSTIQREALWEQFEAQFQTVYPQFLSSLADSFPQLSDMELRICALTRAALNSKQVAKALQLSLRSIENHRYRIRRKLGISTDVSLLSYLSKFHAESKRQSKAA